jgi:hypothetical protein
MELSLAVIVLIALFPIIILRGFVLSRLWAWFLIPLGLPSIGVAHAIGIALIFSAFFSKSSTTNKNNYVERTFEGFVEVLCYWGFGAIVHWFMVRP